MADGIFTDKQLEIFGEKVADLGNYTIGALFIGQLISIRDFDIGKSILGFAVAAVFYFMSIVFIASIKNG